MNSSSSLGSSKSTAQLSSIKTVVLRCFAGDGLSVKGASRTCQFAWCQHGRNTGKIDSESRCRTPTFSRTISLRLALDLVRRCWSVFRDPDKRSQPFERCGGKRLETRKTSVFAVPRGSAYTVPTIGRSDLSDDSKIEDSPQSH